MTMRGLVVSGESSGDTSAYTHRIEKLARCLAERSIPCDFLFPDDSPVHRWTAASVFMLGRLPMLRKYDFIYAGGEEAGQALFLCKPFLRGPVLYDIHGDPEAQSALHRELEGRDGGRASLRVRIVSRMALAAADHVITVSSIHREAFIAGGMDERRVSVIRNGVDLELFRRQPMPPGSAFTFGYAGEFQAWQGVDNLIEAFARVGNPAVRLMIIGFSDEDGELKKELRARFGSRVELVDRVAREKLPGLLGSAHVLVIPRFDHPATRHAFPTKFAEYAALGRPIMVNDVDETASFVRDHHCGFVCDSDPWSMARMMEHAVGIPREELCAMGERARTMAERHFSWSRIGESYADLVRQVVGDYHSRKEETP